MTKKFLPVAAFTAVFAVLAAFVFWGTWSLDVAPVMPDNPTIHSMAYSDYVTGVVRKFLSQGKFIPSDVLWDGLLFSPYFCQELKYAVALYCAGLGLAWFLLGRGLSPLASYGAGLLLTFCGYWASLFSAGHGGWFIWMTYGVFAFGLVDRAVRIGKLRHWLLLGACVAWGSFYQPDLWLLFTVFTGFYFLWCCVRERKSLFGRRWNADPTNAGRAGVPPPAASDDAGRAGVPPPAASDDAGRAGVPPPAASDDAGRAGAPLPTASDDAGRAGAPLPAASDDAGRAGVPPPAALFKGILISAVVFFAIGAPSFRQALVSDLAGRDKQIADGETISSKDAAKGDDAEKRWIFVTNWSLPTDELAEFFIPRLNGDTSCPLTLSLARRAGKSTTPYTGALGRPKDAPSGNYRQHSLYVGFITCLLALVGTVSLFGRRWNADPTETKKTTSDLHLHLSPPPKDIFFFAIAAIVFILFSLGRYCEPVYRLVYALPFGDYLRAPVKWHHLTELCLCVLAGYGIAALMELKFMKNKVATLALCAVVFLGAFDCARIDRLYCAPVNLRRVRATNCDMQMSVLSRADFAKPQVADAARRGQIVSLANYLGHPDYFLVGVLSPRQPNHDPLPPFSTAAALGTLSVLSGIAVVVLAASAGKRKI